MCGIAGIFTYHPGGASICPPELETIRDHMALRGPDGGKSWVSPDGRVGFAHRRLSIIDLSATGSQPMVSACGRFVVTFNGEIYNYRALRQRLESHGHVFVSSSDTEVLLHLYAQKGTAMLEELRGMFAFALLDREQGTVFLGRDPYGIKPLYYADDGRTLRFASQVKALLAGGAISTDPDPAGIAGFFLFGSVPEPFTIFSAIKPLPAGTTVLIGPKGPGEVRSYFRLADAYRAAEESEGNSRPCLGGVRSAVLDSVRHHLAADVPVGAFLSAGIDSGALVGLMRDAGQNEIKTVTIGFAEFANTAQDETPLAQEVARQYGTSHTTRFVTQKEFEDDFPRILAAMDQPSIDGVNTWFVSKAAHEASFTGVPRLASRLSWPGKLPLIPSASRMLVSALLKAKPRVSPKWAGLLEYGGSIEGAYLLRRGLFMPWELPQLMGRDMALEELRRLQPLQRLSDELKPRPRSGFAKLAILESAFYMRNQLLRDTDWASMAHSLEVRVPLVDRTLLDTCAPHTLGFSRSAPSCKALLALSPKLPLPESVIFRAKTGFTTPIGRWLRTAIVNTSPAGVLPAGEVSRALARSILPGVATNSSVNRSCTRVPALARQVSEPHDAAA